MSDYKYIEFKEEKDVARITLNRPPMNVLNIDMLNELTYALKAVQNLNNIKLLIIDAKGKAFSAGLDLKEHNPEKIESIISVFHRVFTLLNTIKVPTLSVVNGDGALGGGCELATFCDIVIAGENAKFAQPEIKVGIMAPIAINLLPRVIGSHRAYEMLFTGREFKGAKAVEIGLINKAVPEENLETEVNNIIKRITANSLMTIKLIKQGLTKIAPLSLEEGLKESEKLYTKSLIKTFDAREGITAIMEKRKPEWKNK